MIQHEYARGVARAQRHTPELSTTAAFMVGKLGQLVSAQFAERLATTGLRPRHCGVLSLLTRGVPGTQQDLGRRLGVVPSAVVGLLDDLEVLGAVERQADPDDRRRHVVVVTARGRQLLQRSEEIAAVLDDELLNHLGSAERAAFVAALKSLAVRSRATGADIAQ